MYLTGLVFGFLFHSKDYSFNPFLNRDNDTVQGSCVILSVKPKQVEELPTPDSVPNIKKSVILLVTKFLINYLHNEVRPDLNLRFGRSSIEGFIKTWETFNNKDVTSLKNLITKVLTSVRV